MDKKPYFEYVKAFNKNAPVKVAIDPVRFPRIVDKTANIYIVEALNALEENQKTDLKAISKGSEMDFTFGDTLKDNIIEIAGPGKLNAEAFEPDIKANTGLGHPYDIVIDMNQNDILDDGDYVDGAGREAGLYVIRDTTKRGPLKPIEFQYNVDKNRQKYSIPADDVPENADPLEIDMGFFRNVETTFKDQTTEATLDSFHFLRIVILL